VPVKFIPQRSVTGAFTIMGFSRSKFDNSLAALSGSWTYSLKLGVGIDLGLETIFDKHISYLLSTGPGGEIGRRKGLKISKSCIIRLSQTCSNLLFAIR